MKNNRFHNRKASGPAALSNSNQGTASNLQNKQYLMQQQMNQNISQERISNYESSIQHAS